MQDGIISLRDLAVTRGSAAFITCRFRRLKGGRIVGFHFREHFDCLMRSCQALGLNPCPRLFTFESLRELIEQQNRQLQYEWGYPAKKDTVVRVMVTAGESYDAMTTKVGRERFFILQSLYRPPSAEPLKLKLVEGVHQMPDVKVTGKYAIPKIYRDQARDEGFDDILFWDDSHGITESFSANFFLVTRDRYRTEEYCLITPADYVLPGVTRNIVFTLARESKLFREVEAYEEDFWFGDFACEEAFLTSTTRGVMPIAKLQDDIVHCNLETGPDTLTAKLQKLYNEYVEDYFQRENPVRD